jgi:hypothetical protein
MARRPCTFRKNDVVRAIKAAKTAGILHPRVEIDLRHGTISIISGEAPETADLNPWLADLNEVTK